MLSGDAWQCRIAQFTALEHKLSNFISLALLGVGKLDMKAYTMECVIDVHEEVLHNKQVWVRGWHKLHCTQGKASNKSQLLNTDFLI